MRILSLAFVLVLSACGFTPLYGSQNGTPVEQSLATIKIDNIADRDGQRLRLRLSDRFYGAHAPGIPQYRLAVTYSYSTENLSIQRNDVATRARMAMTGQYVLYDLRDGAQIYAGSERTFVSYNILTGPYATIAAEEDATDRGLTQLADLITNRIAVFLSAQKELQKEPKPAAP